MIPPLIVREALDRGINLLAITDHNSTANVESVIKAARGTNLVVLPGMELQTVEEVHVLCLFETLEQARSFDNLVKSNLPPTKNNPDYFGEQFVVDETGDFIRREEQMLLISTNLTLRESWQEVKELGGLFIPAHINRKAFGLMPVLGLVPEDIKIEALEISRHISPQEAYSTYPMIKGYPLLQSGDVHYLDDFLGPVYFDLEKPGIQEIRLALLSAEGRRYKIT
jgi:hypothetical protein